MNGLESLKPLLTALVLPPVPWLVMIVWGARWLPRRPRLGRVLLTAGVALVWLSACQSTGRWLHTQLGLAPPALSAADTAALKAQNDGSIAIVVLGGGLVSDPARPDRPELNRASLERLLHGIRLARSTGLPLAFSGGVGWAQRAEAGGSEAEAARRTAEQDFQYRLKWIEPASRDTRENARLSLQLLVPQGVRHIVLVTHAAHMPRAVAMFEQAGGTAVRITAAPMGQLTSSDDPVLDWLPTPDGFEQVRTGLREWLGQQVARFDTPAIRFTAPQSETPSGLNGGRGSGGRATSALRAE